MILTTIKRPNSTLRNLKTRTNWGKAYLLKFGFSLRWDQIIMKEQCLKSRKNKTWILKMKLSDKSRKELRNKGRNFWIQTNGFKAIFSLITQAHRSKTIFMTDIGMDGLKFPTKISFQHWTKSKPAHNLQFSDQRPTTLWNLSSSWKQKWKTQSRTSKTHWVM